ncbi:DUF3800 domain-containing protein [Thermoanaerobacter mathranii]|uniref:DUF3800 domain-containing protein n=1 Tax=Thermoanaerobacter mathranii TaxID=583357 RepID=UPI003D6A13DB
MEIINVYCDESCHLPKDHIDIMVIGAISCPSQQAKVLNKEIRNIKTKYGLTPSSEIKWTKVTKNKILLYKELIDLFFSNDYLSFRAVVVNGKKHLDHLKYNQDYDEWYYKMYFYLLREIVRLGEQYAVYLDKKDTRSSEKISLLRDVLNRNLLDFAGETVYKIQIVQSHEIELLQLTDLFIGAIAYFNRNLTTSEAKINITNYLINTSKTLLNRSTPRKTEKFNIFVWTPRRD